MAESKPPPSQYIVVHWTDEHKYLRPAGEYLARLNDDMTATILRVIEPGGLAAELERLRAYQERHFAPQAEKPIPEARAEASKERKPPSAESLYAKRS